MPLITDHIKESSDKCKQCAFLKLRKIREINFDRNSVLYDEATKALNIVSNVAEGLIWTSCNMCNHGKNFKKVYGVMPYDFFNK
jgi:hypothetical protein